MYTSPYPCTTVKQTTMWLNYTSMYTSHRVTEIYRRCTHTALSLKYTAAIPTQCCGWNTPLLFAHSGVTEEYRRCVQTTLLLKYTVVVCIQHCDWNMPSLYIPSLYADTIVRCVFVCGQQGIWNIQLLFTCNNKYDIPLFYTSHSVTKMQPLDTSDILAKT